jgi:cathepsin B
MMFLDTHGMGELSMYKGYEWVNKVLPTVSGASLLQTRVADSMDLRQRFPACFPDSGVEVVRNQAQCGSCWAFASASTAMNELCVSDSAGRGDDVLANPSDRFEVAVSQIMACNSDQRGCNGGHAQAASTALAQGISKERDAPYACAAGDPMNHFSQASADCTQPPWGRTCDASTRNSDWHFGGVSVVNGEQDMLSFISAGHTLYATLDVMDAFMHMSGDTIYTGGGRRMGGHAVAAVGYGQQGGTKYWILQNSWGPHWGDNGYGKIQRGTNLCGIEQGAYFFRVWTSDGTVPVCLDGASSGLSAGSGEISCHDARNGPYGNLCQHGYYGSHVSSNCPATCGACEGGSGNAADWGSLLETAKPPGKKGKPSGGNTGDASVPPVAEELLEKPKGSKSKSKDTGDAAVPPATEELLAKPKKHKEQTKPDDDDEPTVELLEKRLSKSAHTIIDQIKNLKKSDLVAVLGAVSSAMQEKDNDL